MDKPAAGFKSFVRGRTKIHKCADCCSRRKATTVEERDAFGRAITAQNKASAGALRRHNPLQHLN